MPPAVLLGATLQFYLRSFRPLFVTTLIATLVPSLLRSLVLPEELALAFLWTTLMSALEAAAYAAVLWVAFSIYRGKSSSPSSAVMAVVVFGPRCFAGAFLIVGLALLSIWSVLLLPLAAYLAVRTSLYATAVVVENRNIVDAFQRSWKLVEGRWWRTFGMEAFLFLASLLASLVAILIAGTGAATGVLLAVNTVLTALVAPLLVCFSLLLFEDYRRTTDREPSVHAGPPPDGY